MGTEVTGINDLNWATGFYTNSSGATGFLYQSGKTQLVVFPGAVQTWANGINRKGIIVGSYVTSLGIPRGFARY